MSLPERHIVASGGGAGGNGVADNRVFPVIIFAARTPDHMERVLLEG